MKSLSSVGLAMSVVFGFLLMVLLVELYYISAMVDQKMRTTNARIEGGAANTSKFGFFPSPLPIPHQTQNRFNASERFQERTAMSTSDAGAVTVTIANRKSQALQSKSNNDAKEMHMFVWSSSASPVSGAGELHVFDGADFGANEHSGQSDGAKEIRMLVACHPQNGPLRKVGTLEWKTTPSAKMGKTTWASRHCRNWDPPPRKIKTLSKLVLAKV